MTASATYSACFGFTLRYTFATIAVNAGRSPDIGGMSVMTTSIFIEDSIGCPVAKTADIISNRWTPLILRDLEAGERRFSELARSLQGISPKTLSERLKRLEESGVIERNCFAEVPPRVEYSLTDKGHALLPVINCMREFGRVWLGDEPCQDG
jgi:DNA-binding HxlR family transcriptional regulator